MSDAKKYFDAFLVRIQVLHSDDKSIEEYKCDESGLDENGLRKTIEFTYHGKEWYFDLYAKDHIHACSKKYDPHVKYGIDIYWHDSKGEDVFKQLLINPIIDWDGTIESDEPLPWYITGIMEEK